MEAEKTNPSQTLEEIFAELRKEGREDALSPVIRELINEDFSNERIAKITKLTVEEVIEWRKSL